MQDLGSFLTCGPSKSFTSALRQNKSSCTVWVPKLRLGKISKSICFFFFAISYHLMKFEITFFLLVVSWSFSYSFCMLSYVFSHSKQLYDLRKEIFITSVCSTDITAPSSFELADLVILIGYIISCHHS